MNLTKKLLQVMICLGATALTASAAFFTDDFEGMGSLPAAISTYKNSGTAVWVTNSADDASAIVSQFTGSTNEVLNLDTGGSSLNRTVGNGFDSSDVYVDAKVQFVVSEEAPSPASLSGVKLAVYAITNNATTNLAIYSAAGTTLTSCQITDPTKYYRLTIKLNVNGFSVWVDETQIGDTYGYSVNGDYTLNSVAFQGTGKVDDLGVLAANPLVPPAQPITLSIGSHLTVTNVTAGGAINPATINSGEQILVNAAQWYEVASVAGTDVAVATNAGAVLTGTITVTPTVTASGKTLAITAQAETSTDGMTGSGYFNGAPANKVAKWAIDNGVTALSDGIYKDYLFNVDDGTGATLKISAITVGATDATITVTTDKPTTVTNLSGINGTLKYYATDDLANFGTGVSASVEGAGATVDVTVPTASGKFIKATIE